MQRSISSADIILNFLEVSTHAVLYELKFYQPEIFEQQQIYGLPVFQSRHQDVNAYIDRFFSNSRALIEAGLVRKVIFNILDSFDLNLIYEQISFETSLPGLSHGGPSYSVSGNELYIIEEELRSCLLKLIMECKRLASNRDHSREYTWELNLLTSNDDKNVNDGSAAVANNGRKPDHTGPGTASSQDTVLGQALRSGDWALDNTRVPSEIAKVRSTSRVLHVKGFQSSMLGCNITVHLHKPSTIECDRGAASSAESPYHSKLDSTT